MWGLQHRIKELEAEVKILRIALEKIHKIADAGSKWSFTEEPRVSIRQLAREALNEHRNDVQAGVE